MLYFFFSLFQSFLLCLWMHECDGLHVDKHHGGATAKIITHRAVAVFALMESMKRKQFAIRVLEQDPAYLNLDQRDRAFARLLLVTSERRKGQIKKVIKSFSHQDKKKNSKVCFKKKMKSNIQFYHYFYNASNIISSSFPRKIAYLIFFVKQRY